MSTRLNTFFALWFVSQIVLPFTAPLQACDARDLFGGHGHSAQMPHESSAIPTTDSTGAAAATVSVPGVVAVRAQAPAHSASRTTGAIVGAVTLPSSPEIQQTVLRL